MRTHHHRIRGSSTCRTLVAASACAASLVFVSNAFAGPNDTNPPLPDIMLLLDTSGSMELLEDNCNPDTGLFPDGTGGGTCNGEISNPATWCDGKTTRSKLNRWALEVTALTGSFAGSNGYSCVDMSRSPGTNSAFVNEYSLAYSGGTSVSPYDANYYLNYHRPSQYPGTGNITCVMGFNQTPLSGWYPDNGIAHIGPQTDFNLASIQGYQFDTLAGHLVSPLTPCAFRQNSDGFIPSALESIRFGMMTFDNDTLPNTGVVGTDGQTYTFNDVIAGTPPTQGMWSYFNGWATSTTQASIGRPAGCALDGVSQIPFEVGARNPAAPPWEGRMMRFPSGAQDDPATNNQNISKAIAVMRPYGANPIAGMLDDAKYYFWSDPQGPSVVDNEASCRPQYIVLLTHATPNLDLQTYCQGTALGNAGKCPYDYPEYIAAGLAAGSYGGEPGSGGVTTALSAPGSGAKIKTFVVGFSVEDPKVGATTLHCSDVVIAGSPPQVDPTKCGTEMLNGTDAGAGATDPNAAAYAPCCALARIAVAGGTNAPYFADDLSSALNAILALIVSSETTRATPVVLPQTANTTSGGGAAGATFISSFNVSTNVPWSGDVQRQRYSCASSSGVWQPQAQAIDETKGDDFAFNLWSSGQSGSRTVIAIQPSTPSISGVTMSGTGNVRPYVLDNSSVAFDGYSEYDGAEQFVSYLPSATTPAIPTNKITPDALGLSTAASPSLATCAIAEPDMAFPFGVTATTTDNTTCETIMLNYMLGTTTPAAWTGTTVPFPARYSTTGTTAASSPFGGVFHSTPAIATPPSALLRDDSYQAFITNYSTNYITIAGVNKPRHSVLYVATIDGLLHAFGVDYNVNDNYTFNGSSHLDDSSNTGLANEMWSFIPPAVMGKLGAGGGTLNARGRLDGAPVLKDTVYQRSAVGSSSDWHTTLVAGFGPGQPGYYALDVTDPDVVRHSASDPTPATTHKDSSYLDTANTTPVWPPYMGTDTPQVGLVPLGPHFLWQLTFQNTATDLPPVSSHAAPNDGSSNLFAVNSATPAITTLYFADPDDSAHTKREVGVAILPGGGAAVGATSSGCARTGAAGAAGVPKVAYATPAGSSFQLASEARQWGTSCTAPVAGRSLSIVRLDTGEVLRSFIQMNDFTTSLTLMATKPWSKNSLTGYQIAGRATEADFDSPISGTPVAYPSDIGSIAQRIFVSDQDGVVWRLDVSDTNPDNWFVEPFFDGFNATVNSGTDNDAWALQRSPVAGGALNVTTGRDGDLVLNFGTGNIDAIGITQLPNFVYSVSERPSSGKLIASVNWYMPLNAGEMITGPATVFDGTYYYATYAPGGTTGCPAGTAFLWGMDFVTGAGTNINTPIGSGISTIGGVAELLNPLGGANVQKIASTLGTPPGSAIIPGVAITSTAACASTSTGTDPVTGGTTVNLGNVAPAQYSVTALAGVAASGTSPSTGTGGAKVSTMSYNIANGVRTSTLVDSWASIVE